MNCECLELEGIPSMRETVFLHASSRKLVVQDLAANSSSGPAGFVRREPLWKIPTRTVENP